MQWSNCWAAGGWNCENWISNMTSLLESPSSPCSPKTSASLKMTAMSNDQLTIGHTANNGQMSNGQSPIEQASNGQRLAANGKANGVRSNVRDESEARYCEFTRQSILSDPRFLFTLTLIKHSSPKLHSWYHKIIVIALKAVSAVWDLTRFASYIFSPNF